MRKLAEEKVVLYTDTPRYSMGHLMNRAPVRRKTKSFYFIFFPLKNPHNRPLLIMMVHFSIQLSSGSQAV